MKVMITGAMGMLGKATQTALQARSDLQVIPISRETCDLSDRNAVASLFDEMAPDIVLHCAAKVGGIAANIRSPSGFFVENQLIDQSVIWGAQDSSVPRVVLIGTSSMYPPSDDPIHESCLLEGFPDRGNYGYSLSKALSAKLAILLNSIEKTQYRVLVAPNLFGPHDRTDAETAHLLGAIITKVLHAKQSQAQSIDMWGDGSARREFLFAADLANYLAGYVIDHFSELPDIMNVGAGADYSVLEWYQIVSEACGWRGEIVPDPTKPSGAHRKKLDSAIAESEHHWKPKTSPREGIAALLSERGMTT